MMLRMLRRCAAIAGVLLACTGVRAQVVDQSYTPTPANGGTLVNSSFEGRPIWLAQSFTAGLSGQLTGVDLAIWRDADAPQSLVLQVFEINGLTLGASLGSMPIALAAIAVGVEGSWVPLPGSDPLATHVSLADLHIAVQSGLTYALAVSALDPTAGAPFDLPIVWIGNLQNPKTVDDPYPGGRWSYTYAAALAPGDGLFPTPPLEDLGFRTFVSTVPDAPTAGLALAGLALVLARRRSTAAR